MIGSDSFEPSPDKFHSSWINSERETPVKPIKFQSENLFTKAKRTCNKVMKNITLEPVMFFMSFVGSMDSVSLGQLVIDKSCHLDFNFTEDVCNNLLNDNYTAENAAVENEVAQFKVYESIVDHLFPIICSFFLGSWSDSFGRKILLYIYFAFRPVEGSFLLLNAYFIDWPKEYMLFSVNLPVALSGGYLAFSMGINAFISDISSPDQRSFRMAMMHFVSSIGRPFGTQMGSYLFEQGGYVCVISATLLGRVLSFIFLVIRLEMFQWKPTKVADKDPSKKKHKAFSPHHILDSFKTALKWRPNHKRFYLWVYLIVMMSVILPFFGEMVIGYNYVRTRYHWEVQNYSDFRTFSEIIDIAGQAIFIPLLGMLQIRDSVIIPILLTTIIARDIIKGFAVYPWMYYFGSVVNVMGGYSFAASRSIISKCVENDELGKVFALLSSMESVVPIGMSQAYATIWENTSELGAPWVGTVFFVSGALTSIALVISIFSLMSLKGQSIGDLDDTLPSRPRYRHPMRRLSLQAKTGAWARAPFQADHFDAFDTFDNIEVVEDPARTKAVETISEKTP